LAAVSVNVTIPGLLWMCGEPASQAKRGYRTAV
jgi:hypothetical protein